MRNGKESCPVPCGLGWIVGLHVAQVGSIFNEATLTGDPRMVHVLLGN